MQRAAQIASCTCEHCSPVPHGFDRIDLWAGAIAFALVPSRALLHLAGIL